jgi:hypothetical protein
MLADNRLPEDAVWDLEELAIGLKEPDAHLQLTIESTGFETAEIDRILEKDEFARVSKAEILPESDPEQPAVSCLDDRAAR